MGRAIVRDPQVFLFDEPLSNLDAKLRVQMRTEIRELHQRLNSTSIYVTHDQIEAMTMADQIVVMRDGNIEQLGAPLDLYDHPNNTFVAGFIGSPAMNLIEGTLQVANGHASVAADDGSRLELAPGRGGTEGTRVYYGVPAGALHPDRRGPGPAGRGGGGRAGPARRSWSSAAWRGPRCRSSFKERHDFTHGQRIYLQPRRELSHIFDRESGQVLR